MARKIPEAALQAIEEAARAYPEGATAQQIAAALQDPGKQRTLQFRLKYLVDHERLAQEGIGRWAKYRLSLSKSEPREPAAEPPALPAVPLSTAGEAVQKSVRQHIARRKPVGYDREFLDSYRPNVTAYLTAAERTHLRTVGTSTSAEQPAGTYAKQILNRLLIDLSWNSSRLEGNTYSLLDAKRLIDFGQEAEGKERLEALMILNHKDAIEFLVSTADDIGFNRYTILNLHALLANNLLADPTAPGRLRNTAVGIGESVYHPPEVPQLIEECFDQLLATAAAIKDPFEQVFFVTVQIPYLQPFDDVNKRVSRLAANIPLIKHNLAPLAFSDVPRSIYTEAMLGVYELKKIDLLKDVYLWAYERSAARLAAVRQSVGEPDPFRLKHRSALREIVGEVVHGRMDKKAAFDHVAAWSKEKLDSAEQNRFQEMAESELLGLHEGNFARYQIRPSEFEAWQKTWNAR